MRLIHSAPATGNGATATVAQVTFSEGGSFGALGATEQRGIPAFGPRGIAYRPCEGDNLLVLRADGAEVCAGVLHQGEDLPAGELRLASSGGAVIHLKNNGDLVLNGVVITRDGEILRA